MARKGILGRKLGMTQIFDEEGRIVPVTVIEAGPNVVLQKKTPETDGYVAIQLGFLDKKPKRATKPEKGHAAKAGTAPKRFVREIRDVELDRYEVGQTLTVDLFAPGELVDVTGTSKGKGTQGAIKRHNQARGPMAHGSGYHRGIGSRGAIGPYRILKGTPGPGRMGNERVTVQNLLVVKVIPDKHLLLVKGAVPGPRGGFVIVRSAIKAPQEA
ncbi:MAG: 50S ribosomal protein L3 [Hydrogenibacillus schlegelii]|uniref:Large ribosomal subunit protein uL3 n=1 Tax=Hydrogenibacillus schlegelii TaxID=1484 RepID=A0A2T5G9J9_HYDSH|nr:50S ribosomal protein L3 [Hydrogenibacillus schlegelii]MBT9283158.1 50S ribosomal protein L3 [Hydrogenibacillus schlegelii]PTQ52857.1 MAG: LSU ribosomal protein L3p (L3e) [Hydrogenibacillus schlegelii]